MTAIDYSSGSRVVTERPHTVYTKPTWSDAWTQQPNMTAIECLWVAAPGVNSARLRWEIGNVILPGDSTPTTISPWTGRGQFVKVDWLCDDGSTVLTWVGFIDVTTKPNEAFGHQELVAYGLEHALTKTTISRTVWWDDQAADTAVSQVAQPFNGPHGLRCDDPDGDGVYYFRDPRLDLPADANSTPWSTREIVRYLLTQMLPTDNLGVTVIPWQFAGIDLLPDWDSPRVDTEYRTVWDVLTELVSPSRLLGFTCGSDGSSDVTIKFFTHVAADLTISGHTIPANPTQHTLVTQPDALTNANYADVGGGYDQVICRGAKKQVICTLQTYSTTAEAPLIPAWTDDQKNKYNAGASTQVGYSILTDEEKRRANSRVRTKTELSKVYRTYRLNPAISTKLADFTKFCRLLNRLPIKPGKDWTGTVVAAKFDRDGEGIPLFVTFGDPTIDPFAAEKRVAASGVTALDAQITTKRSFGIRVHCSDREVNFDVVGAEQHLLADSSFTALPVDDVKPILSVGTAQVTLAIEYDQHLEGKYPTSSPSANVVRRLIIDAGPDYHYIEILGTYTGVPRTVASLKFDSTADLSDGGTLVNDTEKLNALARFIAQSYALTRQSVNWQSQRKIGSVAVGDLITTSDGAIINSPVTAISITGGVSINRPAGATVQSFETYRGSADPFALLAYMRSGPKRQLPMRIVDTGAKRV